jgi:phage head maturation protease
MDRGAAQGALELRRAGDGSVTITGSFPYGRPAVLSDGGRSGRPVKEVIEAAAFSYTLADPSRDVLLLLGHDFDHVLAARRNGSLALRDTPAALILSATIAPAILRTSYAQDTVAQIEAGLAGGLSPGFRLPPERAVPRAEAETVEEEPDDGKPSPLDGQPQRGALIRRIRQAILVELSVVTRPAYAETSVELVRALGGRRPHPLSRWRP